MHRECVWYQGTENNVLGGQGGLLCSTLQPQELAAQGWCVMTHWLLIWAPPIFLLSCH
jgi:hypothetical protein